MSPSLKGPNFPVHWDVVDVGYLYPKLFCAFYRIVLLGWKCVVQCASFLNSFSSDVGITEVCSDPGTDSANTKCVLWKGCTVTVWGWRHNKYQRDIHVCLVFMLGCSYSDYCL